MHIQNISKVVVVEGKAVVSEELLVDCPSKVVAAVVVSWLLDVVVDDPTLLSVWEVVVPSLADHPLTGALVAVFVSSVEIGKKSTK